MMGAPAPNPAVIAVIEAARRLTEEVARREETIKRCATLTAEQAKAATFAALEQEAAAFSDLLNTCNDALENRELMARVQLRCAGEVV